MLLAGDQNDLGFMSKNDGVVDHRWFATSVVPRLVAFLVRLWHQGNFVDATTPCFACLPFAYCLKSAMITGIVLGAVGLHGPLGTISSAAFAYAVVCSGGESEQTAICRLCRSGNALSCCMFDHHAALVVASLTP